MLPVTQIRELEFSGAESPAFLSAASGLVVTESSFVVIADDDLHLGIFPRDGGAGVRRRVLPGKLSSDAAQRKAQKPDFEALVRLPPLETAPRGALLALGSGSTPRRCRGVVIPLDASGTPASASELFDFTDVYGALHDELPELNIEGAVVDRDRLLLFQRGNGKRAENAVAILDLGAVLRCIVEGRAITRAHLRGVRRLPALGDIDGVPLSVTDAAALREGRILFSAVAEDTDDPYLDGACHGAALGVLDSELAVTDVRRLEGSWKVEGIALEPGAEATLSEILLVADADDPSRAAPLLRTVWS